MLVSLSRNLGSSLTLVVITSWLKYKADNPFIRITQIRVINSVRNKLFSDALGLCLCHLKYEIPLGEIIGWKRGSTGTSAGSTQIRVWKSERRFWLVQSCYNFGQIFVLWLRSFYVKSVIRLGLPKVRMFDNCFWNTEFTGSGPGFIPGTLTDTRMVLLGNFQIF